MPHCLHRNNIAITIATCDFATPFVDSWHRCCERMPMRICNRTSVTVCTGNIGITIATCDLATLRALGPTGTHHPLTYHDFHLRSSLCLALPLPSRVRVPLRALLWSKTRTKSKSSRLCMYSLLLMGNDRQTTASNLHAGDRAVGTGCVEQKM